jgi:AcrR family transcriptional regulator
MRLLEKDGIDALTTNAVAASAGVSIGTLYQFFPNKEAILDALADHEISGMSNRVARVMEDESIATTEERIAAIVNAVAASYGARQSAHRQVMAHSLSHGGNRLSPLLAHLVTHLTSERQAGAIRHALGESDAFVLAHAFAGVLRAMIGTSEHAPQQDDIARGLARLVTSFLR